jgi:mRNA interferase YafQ
LQKAGFRHIDFRKCNRNFEAKGKLPRIYKPHKLTGNYIDCWECHLQPDWLLVWKQNDTELILLFTNTGTHSDLF